MNTRENRLASYLRQFLVKELDQLAYHRFFRGTVASVDYLGSGIPSVSIVRTGESGTDGNTYVVGPGGYTPQVGDDVECVWRDRRRGYVLWPLNASAGSGPRGLMPGSPVLLAPGSITVSGTAEAAVSGATVPFTAVANRRYRVTVSAIVGVTSGIMTLGLRDGGAGGIAGTLVWQANHNPPAGGNQNFAMSAWLPNPLVGPLATGPHTLQLTTSAAAGTIYNATTYPVVLAVEDVGGI